MLVCENVITHAPKGRKCEQGYIKLGELLPAHGEKVPHDHGAAYQHSEKPDGCCSDRKIDLLEYVSKAFQFIHSLTLQIWRTLSDAPCNSKSFILTS